MISHSTPASEQLRRAIAGVGWIAALAGTLSIFFLAMGLAFSDAKLAPAQACAMFVAALALVCRRALMIVSQRLDELEASVLSSSAPSRRERTPAV